jgi:hypothetical protein
MKLEMANIMTEDADSHVALWRAHVFVERLFGPSKPSATRYAGEGYVLDVMSKALNEHWGIAGGRA